MAKYIISIAQIQLSKCDIDVDKIPDECYDSLI